MKNEFENTALIERYLLNMLSPDEKKDVENRIQTDPDFKMDVAQQLKAIELLKKGGRMKIKNELMRADRAYRRNRIFNYTAVGMTMLLTIIGGYFFLINGNTNSDQPVMAKKEFISPPLPQLDVQFTEYKIEAEKGGTIRHPSGTVLKIPANALVDQNGQPIKGEATIKYREINTPAEILLSGIPMAFEENGKKIQLESAGMMELKAYAGSTFEEVKLAKDKNISVAYASLSSDPDMNLYYLNIQKKTWELTTPKIPVVDSLEMQKPEKPIKVGEEEGFSINADSTDVPELKNFRRVRWVPQIPKEKFDYLMRNYYTDIKVVRIKKGLYKMILKGVDNNHGGKPGLRVEIKVKPIYSEKEYYSAFEEYEKERVLFEKELENREKNRELWKSEETKFSQLTSKMKYYRQYEINQFGVCNLDKPYNYPKKRKMKMEFKHKGKKFIPFSYLWLVDKSVNTIFQYETFSDKCSIGYNPDSENYLIGINEQFEWYIIPNSSFTKIPKNAKESEMEFIKIDKPNSTDDLVKLIGNWKDQGL